MKFALFTKIARVMSGVLIFICAMALQAQAGTATSITGLYTTGLDGADNGTRDDHWKMSDGNFAYVVSNNNVTSNGWVANGTSAKWISYASNGSSGLGSGTYTYTLSFNIAGSGTGAVSGVNVYMTLAVDDSAIITVNGGNGVSTTGSGQWSRTQNVTLSNGFVIGTNTITITVSNSGSGPSGVMVSSISGVVPEVGAWIPLAMAFGLLAWARFRPRKNNLPAAV
ncbi:MAG: hypothetical protein QM715_09040 [Nibricoccus sp.]